MRIDAHQHFWSYSPAEYDWIGEEMRAIRRDFLPPDLAPLLTAAGLDGTVAVQARQSLTETDWLLRLSDSARLIKGVVGWVPLAGAERSVISRLERYCEHPRFKGVRRVLQSEPDACFSDDRFNAALDAIESFDLAYDLLIFARQLPAALPWVDRHARLRIVLDHIAKPVVNGAPAREWRAHIRELGWRPNVSCKFSGVVTEVPGWQWTPELVRPYFEVVLEAFGPERLMFGSDWPVCLVAADYARWVQVVEDLVRPLSPDERAAIMGGTAAKIYRITS
ncbi:MAG TPA: amidohydrolase family protein [Opitutus sp.]|nr:amidohydrolase family protein [Opitutus sp.]